MKLPRTTRGTSAPPISLTTASMRLHATTTSITLRPRRRNANQRNSTPDIPRERLGSPFAFHPSRSRAGTPSTVTSSVAESLQHHHHHHNPQQRPGTSQCAYWLRSSRETEWEYRVGQLRTPGDLRLLIEYVLRMGDAELLERCRGILVEVLGQEVAGVAGGAGERGLWGMEMGVLMQKAEVWGFWRREWLPGVERAAGVDRYTTPPGQTLWRSEEMQMG